MPRHRFRSSLATTGDAILKVSVYVGGGVSSARTLHALIGFAGLGNESLEPLGRVDSFLEQAHHVRVRAFTGTPGKPVDAIFQSLREFQAGGGNRHSILLR
ncbi:MAG TPA: hypothetical protein VFB75_17885 [Burkholderiales bacterium]|nr:hypothetical protein [Burkholderiales bacterium]